jgi:hypothetical protein
VGVEDMDMDKTCDTCKHGENVECFDVVGMCDDYSKWESDVEGEEEEEEEKSVGEDLLTIIRGTLTKEEFQGYCLGKYLEATYEG